MNRKTPLSKVLKDIKLIDKASGVQPIELPPPKFGRCKSVVVALQKRQTVREMSDKKLSLQMLSNFLWAASGVNRKKGPFCIPGRTAGSASNSQEIDIYVTLPEGVFLYEAAFHRLTPVVSGDFRVAAIGPGQGAWGAHAPVRFIYVVDIDKFKSAGFQEPGLNDPDVQKSYYFVDTGLIAENVYLFAASQGLATWFHNCDKKAAKTKLKLRPNQRALFGQTIGYSEKE
jgi:nitroreductase